MPVRTYDVETVADLYMLAEWSKEALCIRIIDLQLEESSYIVMRFGLALLSVLWFPLSFLKEEFQAKRASFRTALATRTKE